MNPDIFNSNSLGASDSDIGEVNTKENQIDQMDDENEFISIDRRCIFLAGLTFLCWEK